MYSVNRIFAKIYKNLLTTFRKRNILDTDFDFRNTVYLENSEIGKSESIIQKGERTMVEEKLKAYVDDHAISLPALAEKSGLDRRLFSRVFNEGQKLKADDLITICKTLNIKVDDLLGE